jgi:hypothetical protein
MVRNIETGRFERSPSALTAGGALVTAAAICLEHDSASFGNKMMWAPIVLGPVGAAADVAGFSAAGLGYRDPSLARRVAERASWQEIDVRAVDTARLLVADAVQRQEAGIPGRRGAWRRWRICCSRPRPLRQSRCSPCQEMRQSAEAGKLRIGPE